jgi:elongation factor Ts
MLRLRAESIRYRRLRPEQPPFATVVPAVEDGEDAMAITAKDVAGLRERTGVGMMECKKALEETGGDLEAAIDLLRKRLKGKMDERAGRPAGEGAIAIATRGPAGVMIELRSETDFTARNDIFLNAAQRVAELALEGPEGEVKSTPQMQSIIDDVRMKTKENVSLARGVKLSGGVVAGYQHHNRQLGALVQGEGALPAELLSGLCQHVVASVPTPMAVDESGLPADQHAKQKELAVEEAEASGKPREIAEKMAVGKVKKWVDEHTLLGQIYLRELDKKKPVRDYVPKGAKLTRFVRYAVGQP